MEQIPSVFNDPACYREITQWKAVFNNPSMTENTQPLFSNFGSISEIQQPSKDFETISRSITERFAMDVFMELRNELQTDSRGISTSHTERKGTPKPITPHKTPNVTPHNSRRGPRNYSLFHS